MRAARLDEPLFEKLALTSGEDLISVFLPTHSRSRDIAQDRIRLKNQVSAIDRRLAGLGWKPRHRSERLAAAEDLLDDREFWEHQDAGLAIYIDEAGDVEPVSITRPVATTWTVMPVYLLRPLMADLHGLRAFVLALTKDEVALFAATRSVVEPIDAELPAFDDVNWFVDREPQRQHRPDRAGTRGNRHGHEPTSGAEEDIARFLRELEAALGDFDSADPLIVLGDDDLVSRFAKVSRRPTLSPRNSGIPAPFSIGDVRDRVTAIVTELEESRVEEARVEAGSQLGIGKATIDIREAVPAAVAGRVGRVVISGSAPPMWGRLSESRLDAEIHDNQEPGDVDLLDRLVVWARDHGAEVIATESGIDDDPFVATYRY